MVYKWFWTQHEPLFFQDVTFDQREIVKTWNYILCLDWTETTGQTFNENSLRLISFSKNPEGTKYKFGKNLAVSNVQLLRQVSYSLRRHVFWRDNPSSTIPTSILCPVFPGWLINSSTISPSINARCLQLISVFDKDFNFSLRLMFILKNLWTKDSFWQSLMFQF